MFLFRQALGSRPVSKVFIHKKMPVMRRPSMGIRFSLISERPFPPYVLPRMASAHREQEAIQVPTFIMMEK